MIKGMLKKKTCIRKFLAKTKEVLIKLNHLIKIRCGMILLSDNRSIRVQYNQLRGYSQSSTIIGKYRLHTLILKLSDSQRNISMPIMNFARFSLFFQAWEYIQNHFFLNKLLGKTVMHSLLAHPFWPRVSDHLEISTY